MGAGQSLEGFLAGRRDRAAGQSVDVDNRERDLVSCP